MTIGDRLRHNLGLKLLSLGIALVIWGAVHNQADPLVVRHRAVRVEAVDVPATLAVASIEPEQVTVTLFGRASAFDQLEYANLRLVASVPVNQVGVHAAPVEAEGLPEGLEIRQFSRTMVKVELDAVVSASRPVFVETRGEPASGFTAAASEARPNAVTIRGPSSGVQKVARVVAEVDISGRAATVPAPVALAARDANNLAVGGVEIEPSQVTVTVQIRQISSKTVPVVPVISNVPSGYEVTEIHVKPVTATLTGPGRLLTGLEAVQTGAISLSGARGRGTYNAPLRLPEGLSVVGAAAVVVTVNLRQQRHGAAGEGSEEPAAPAATPPPATPSPPASPATGAATPAPETPAPVVPPAGAAGTPPVTPARAGAHGHGSVPSPQNPPEVNPRPERERP